MNKKTNGTLFLCVPSEVIDLDYSNPQTHCTLPKPGKPQPKLEQGNHKMTLNGACTMFHLVTHFLQFCYDTSIVLWYTPVSSLSDLPGLLYIINHLLCTNQRKTSTRVARSLECLRC